MLLRVGEEYPFEMLSDIRYGTKYEDYVFLFTVPKCFRTDFASMPALIRCLVFRDWELAYAALLHDYLYSEEGARILSERFMTSNQEFLRKVADDIFLNVMLESGVRPFLAKIIYRIVRIFGGNKFVKLSKNE